MDLTQATGGKTVQAVGEAFGFEDLAESGKQFAAEQQAEADRTAIQGRAFGDDFFGALGDVATESLPSLGTIGTGAAAGAGIGSLVAPGPGTVVGGLIGLGLSSLGLNIGTVKEIEESLDPESESNIASLAIAGAATIPDLLTGGALTQTAKQATKTAVKSQLAKSIAKDAAIGTGAAVASQGILDVGASLTTDTGFDEDRVDAITENIAVSALLEGLATSGASGLGTLAGQAAKKQGEFEDEHSVVQFDEEGRPVIVRPNPEVLAAPDVLKEGAAAIRIGRSVDEMERAARGDGDDSNLGVKDIARDLDQTFDERTANVGRTTVNTEAQLNKADYKNTANYAELSQLSRKQRDEVRKDIVEGNSTPLADAVRSGLRQARDQNVKAGKKIGDLGKTYLPFSPDVKAIRKNKNAFIDEMVDAGAKRPKVVRYVNEILNDGGLRLADATEIPAEIQRAQKLMEAGDVEKAEAILQKPMRSVNTLGRINENNNLDLHRQLSEVDQKTLEKWTKKEDLLDTLDVYLQMAGEQAAYAERFGANNERLHERVRLAMLEGQLKGNPLTPKAVQKIYDVTNLQQRITSTQVGQRQRDVTAATKTLFNLKTLPFAVIASVLEPLFLAPKTGAKSFVKGGLQSVETMIRKAARTVFDGVPRSEHELLLDDLNTSFREAMSTTAARIGESTVTPSSIDSKFFKYNGLSAWTEFTRVWSQLAAVDAFKSDGRILLDPSTSRRDQRKAALRLGEAGLDPSQVMDWVETGASKDHPYYRQMRAGAIDLAEDVIFNPKPANKPTWTSEPNFFKQMFAHLKTFPLQFNNRLLIPVAKKLQGQGAVGNMENALKTLITTGIAVPGFMMIDALKTFAREGSMERWEEESPREKVLGAMGQFGSFSLAVDPLTASQFGGTPLEAVVGPFFSSTVASDRSVVANIGKVMAGDMTPEEGLEAAIRSLPNIAGSREALTE